MYRPKKCEQFRSMADEMFQCYRQRFDTLLSWWLFRYEIKRIESYFGNAFGDESTGL